MIFAIVTIVGLLIGGILNVLADTLPKYETPKHITYSDGTPRPILAWMGILAFITGNRTSPNDKTSRLSWRYPLTEIATALMFIITVWRANVIVANGTPVNTLQLIFWLYYAAIFVLITVIDIEHHLILFAVIIPSSIIAILDTLLTPTDPTFTEALIGGGIGFGVFFLFYVGGFLYVQFSASLRGQSTDEIAFGYGDVMLITLSGLILGWQPLIFAIFITVALGAIGAILFLIGQRLRGGQGGMLTPLPYGPYIVIGTVVMLLFSDVVRDFLIYNIYIR